MQVGSTAKLAAVVGEHKVDLRVGLIERRDDVVAREVHRGDRQFAQLAPRRGVPQVTVDGGLHRGVFRWHPRCVETAC